MKNEEKKTVRIGTEQVRKAQQILLKYKEVVTLLVVSPFCLSSVLTKWYLRLKAF